jgi:hypothetical protein
MGRLRRFASAMVMTGMIAGGMLVATARVEAAGKKGGGDGQAATCEYLLNIITYPYVSPVIRASALSLYISLGCSTQP